MDTSDGIGAGPKKRYKAMKDSRVGAMGVQSLVIIMILQIAAVIKLGFFAPYAFPIAAFWGRLSQVFAIGNYKYITKKQSKSIHKKYWEGLSKELIPSIFLILLGIIIFLFLHELNIANILLLITYLSSGLATSTLIPYYINKSLGGHNGDSYGASLVVTETANMLIMSMIMISN